MDAVAQPNASQIHAVEASQRALRAIVRTVAAPIDCRIFAKVFHPVYDVPVTATLSILVLDDDPTLRHMLQVMLQHDGHHVVTSADAQSALAQCAVQLPELMIVDLMLPVEDGEIFLREFRRRFRDVNVPVVLLSASSARNDIGRRLGVEATLAKPFVARDLRDLVSDLATKRDSVAAG